MKLHGRTGRHYNPTEMPLFQAALPHGTINSFQALLLKSTGPTLTINQPERLKWQHAAPISVQPPEGLKSQRIEARCPYTPFTHCDDCRSALPRQSKLSWSPACVVGHLFCSWENSLGFHRTLSIFVTQRKPVHMFFLCRQ